jgi:hypothetical protein
LAKLRKGKNMKIYTNNNFEIIALNDEPKEYAHVFTCCGGRYDLFGNLCDVVVQGYKYEPKYELLFNEDGSNARDEKTGELLYKLDENGDKMTDGYSCHPFVDYQTLMLIQKQYEDSRQQLQTLNARIEYLSKMSGIETEIGYE